MCSEVGACVARLECVPQCWSACSKLGACAAWLVKKIYKKAANPAIGTISC